MNDCPTVSVGRPERPSEHGPTARAQAGQAAAAEPLPNTGRRKLRHGALGAVLSLFAFLEAEATFAATYYVDQAHPSCSDTGPGTSGTPYCAIQAAVTARGGAGTTIVVRAGTYREQVTVGAAGQAGAPFVIRGEGAPTLDGSDDYGSAALWTLLSGNVWKAASVTWTPKQVFVAGQRLTESTLAPASLPSGSFRHVVGEGLYVNAGGGNPGLQSLRVGRRIHGFKVSSFPWVTIEGFAITRTDDRGIYVASAADNAVIANNAITLGFRSGIQVSNSAGVSVLSNQSSLNLDHGIALSSAVGAIVRDNHCFSNTKPGGTSSGLYLSSSSSGVFEANRLHDNTGSGFYAQTASNGNRVVQNRSWRNARQGFDLYGSTGTQLVGNVAFGNGEDGFAVRNASTGTTLHDGIASGNTGKSLLVETNSTTGFAANDNVYFPATPGAALVRWGATDYTTVSAFAGATGHDTRTFGADPRFVDPLTGNFELSPGSPALDAANTSVAGWPALDALGRSRRDDPSAPNTGLGPVAYADRGALERMPGLPPVARLVVTPASGNGPLLVTADASTSTPVDGAIATYRFDWGDGTSTGPQAGATATHTYGGGAWTATVTVTDVDGESDTATAVVEVVQTDVPPNGIMEAPGADLSLVAGQMVVLLASGSDPDGDLPLTFEWDLGGAAPNLAVEDPGPVRLDVPGTFTITLRVRDAGGLVDPTPPSRTITVTSPAALPADEIHWTVTGPTSVTFDWRGAPTTIAYGTTQAYGQTATAVTPTPSPYSSAGPFREARLADLLPNTLYHYSIGGGPDHTFRTPPPRGASGFSVMVNADIGSTRDYDNVAAMQALIAWQRPALVILPGDLTYGDDKGAPSVDAHFNDVMAWSQDAPYMPMWGNHEWGSTVDDLRNYKGRFDLPNARAATGAPLSGCCGEDWYWFDYGNVRFIAYPEPYTSSTWTNWYPSADSLMEAVRGDAQIRFIVTFGHRPAYSSGHHDGDAAIERRLDSLGVRHPKYVLNVNGHSHNYERSHPQHGVIHVTSGGGGSSLETESGICPWGGGCPAPAWSAFRAFRHGALRLRITQGGIVGEALCGPADPDQNLDCAFGSVFDQFVIGVPDMEPVVTVPASVSGAETQPLTVAVTAADPDLEPIGALTADLTGLPAGHGAVFTAAPDQASGTLTWTPGFADSGTYVVRFRAENALAGEVATTLRIANTDRAPVVGAAGTTTVNEAAPLTLAITASDPDGDAIGALSASGLPAGAVFEAAPDQASGTLTWTPTHADSGAYAVTFTATNALSGAQAVTLRVVNVDRPPVVGVEAAVSATENAALALTVTASDPDGDAIAALTASLAGLPAGHGATFTPAPGNASGTLAWTPSFAAAPGPYTVSFTAANALSSSASASIAVANVDRAPALTAPATVTVAENQEVVVDVGASDPDGEAIASLAAALAALPAGHNATFTAAAGNAAGTLRWRPTFADSGSFTIPFTASNALSGAASTVIRVTNVDRAPVVTAPATASGAENAPLSITVTASDPDGDPITALTANLASLPAGHGATFTPTAGNASGTLSWTPSFAAAPGPYAVTFTATNALGASATTSIAVTNVDRAPVVTAPATVTVTENAPLSVTVTASDPDGDPLAALSANLAALPAGHGATFTPAPGNASGTLTWTPSFAAAPGPYAIAFTATNALGGSATTSIAVTNVDRAPAVTAPASVSVVENQEVVVSVGAADPDGDAIAALTAALGALPAGHNATFTVTAGNASGTLRWRPTSADSGAYTIPFTASNALAGAASTVIRVSNVDRAPVVIAPATASVAESAPLTVTVTASDPDGDPITALTANLASLPSGHGATFTPAAGNASGTLSWTPSFAAAPGPYAVTFTATNALGATATTSIAVTNVDRAPVVTAPATASGAENTPLTVTVTASDPDGDPITSLTANLASLPAGHGATFTSAPGNGSGTLTWTPSFAAAPGPYAITFTATNALGGSATSSIAVTNTDRAPVVGAPAGVTVAENQEVVIDVTAADPDGDAIASLTANLASLPPGHGATFTVAPGNASGTLRWRPTPADSGLRSVSFTATNALSGTAVSVIRVSNVDRPPVVTAPATASVAENAPLAVTVTASDPDGDPIAALTANLASLPPGHGATFTPASGNASGTLAWTPSFAAAPGPYAITFSATNALGATTTTSITVTNVDRPPVLAAPGTATAVEGAPFTLTITASDPDGEPIGALTASLAGLPAGHGATFTPAPGNGAGTLAWTPGPADAPGPYVVTFGAQNALAAAASVSIAVTNQDRPPVVTAPAAVTVAEGAPLAVAVTASDPDGEPIATLAADLGALPAGHGAVFVPNAGNGSGTLTWTPGYQHGGGPYAVRFTAGNALEGAGITAITVGHVDRPPVVSTPSDTLVVAGHPCTLTVTAADPDGEPIGTLAADLASVPGAAFAPAPGNATGRLTWTPALGDTGERVVPITATNALAGSGALRIVVSANRAPIAVLELLPLIGIEPLGVTASAAGSSDPDGRPLTYRFDFGDGAVTAAQSTPLATHFYGAGSWVAKLVVTDAAGASDSALVPLTVLPNLITNPSFESALTGWNAYNGSTLARVPGGPHGLWALEVQGPASTATFGVNDSPDWISRTAVAGHRYRYTAWVRGVSGGGSGRLQIREYLNGVQQGPTVLSPLVPFSSEWKPLSAECVAWTTGSSLNFQVLGVPTTPSSKFLVDALGLRVETPLTPVEPGTSALRFTARVLPNPVRGAAVIALTLPEAGAVEIRVLDVTGRLCQARTVRLAAGASTLPLLGDGRAPLPPGIYFLRATTPKAAARGRFIVLD